MSTLNFTLTSPMSSKFGPRLGSLIIQRPNHPDQIFATPGLLASTSRGVIPHLSRDHYAATSAVQWAHVPFESFVELTPPIPTLQRGENPLHAFLGFTPSQHVLSMSIRDPSDEREMPPNSNTHISAYCLRGVRKVSPEQWRTYTLACKPDIAFALTDTPYTDPPYSQKRLTKSIERSFAWLADLLRPLPPTSRGEDDTVRPGGGHPLNVFVQLAGGASLPARRAFSQSLLENLFGKDSEAIAPLRHLDEGVSGYVFDLAPLRHALLLSEPEPHELPPLQVDFTTHLTTSLEPLPAAKPRLATSPQSPHEILRLIQTVGIDIFDTRFAQRAADLGVALDFEFPAPPATSEEHRDIGHNIYDTKYAFDFSALGSPNNPCSCFACTPIPAATRIAHCSLTGLSNVTRNSSTDQEGQTSLGKPSYTRAYIHHLLHTHEMSAHTLLVTHNLSTVSNFFVSIRKFLSHHQGDNDDAFGRAISQFHAYYDETLSVLDGATTAWKEVDLARGKGRLKREKEKEATLVDNC